MGNERKHENPPVRLVARMGREPLPYENLQAGIFLGVVLGAVGFVYYALTTGFAFGGTHPFLSLVVMLVFVMVLGSMGIVLETGAGRSQFELCDFRAYADARGRHFYGETQGDKRRKALLFGIAEGAIMVGFLGLLVGGIWWLAALVFGGGVEASARHFFSAMNALLLGFVVVMAALVLYAKLICHIRIRWVAKCFRSSSA